jgi:adenosylhomocysteine nucleosidase
MASEARMLFGPGRWQSARDDLNWRIIKPLKGPNLLIARGGPGPKRAKAAAAWLIEMGAAAIVNPGLAGGLSPKLAPGQIIVAESAYELNDTRLSGPFYNNLPQVIHALDLIRAHGIPAHQGALVSSRHPVLDQTHKAALHQSSQALGVDMESAAVIQTARQAKVACIIIRAVCDPADYTVPRALFDILDQKGRVKWPDLLGACARNPMLIKSLITSGGHFSAARKSLRQSWQALQRADFWQHLIDSAAR